MLDPIAAVFTREVRVHPELITSQSQGANRQTNIHTQIHTYEQFGVEEKLSKVSKNWTVLQRLSEFECCASGRIFTNLRPLLWVLLCLSLLVCQCHPVGRHERVEKPVAALFKLEFSNTSEKLSHWPDPPPDTYRNTWLSRGSRLPSLSWITLLGKKKVFRMVLPIAEVSFTCNGF